MNPLKPFAFLAVLFLLACSSSDPIETMITASDTAGAYPVAISTERLNGKISECGYMIAGTAAILYDIDYQVVRPTLLSMIKQIHRDDRECDWISVYLYTEEAGNGFQVGCAHYQNGQVEIMYGIPSDELMAESQELKKQKSDPALKGQVDDVWGLPLYDPDYQAIRLPTIDEYSLGVKIESRYYNIDNELAQEDLKQAGGDEYMALLDTRDDRIYQALAAELDVDEAEIRRIDKLCKNYYGLAYSSETITPPQ